MAERRPFSVTRLPGFTAIALVTFALLYAPIVTLVVFSFNDSETIAIWGGFSWRWYAIAWQNTAVQEATIRSLP